jgi:hypothetical protein
MENLPHNQTLTDGTEGWKREPRVDILSDRLNNYWLVKTNVKTYDRFEFPDIYIMYRQSSKMQATLYRNLGVNNSKSWSLSGEINYEGNYPSTDMKTQGAEGSGGQFLEILDEKGKVIFRFFPQLNYNSKLIQLIANGIVIAAENQPGIERITNRFQPFTLKLKDGKLQFNYA